MIIGIDGNEANIEIRVGVNMYAYELLKNLWKLQGEWSEKHRLIVYLKDNPVPGMPEETANFKYKILKGGPLWILTKLTPELFFGDIKPDVFLSPSHYSPFMAPVRKVCSIMDLGYLDFSEQFTKKVFWQLKWWTAISILVAKKVLCISENTKKNIVRHYPFASNKVEVTHLGYDNAMFNKRVTEDDVRHIKNKYSIVDDYILYLGTLKPSKNIEGLIKAFALIKDKYPRMQLVIAGKKGWLYQNIFTEVKNNGLQDKVVFTDYIADQDKAPLIKGAKAFAIPSLWEGFGLDVLSAMACGIPVVASDRGSLPEVAGDAGVLVNPLNPASIARGLEKILSASKTEYNRIVERGLIQASKFSWEKTARQTLDILENV